MTMPCGKQRSVPAVVVLLSFLAILLPASEGALFGRRSSSKRDGLHILKEENFQDNLFGHTESIDELKSRFRRANGDDDNHPTYSEFPFVNDNNPAGRVHYSGTDSKVLFVLTFRRGNTGRVISSNLYRSGDYGKSFQSISIGFNFTVGRVITSPEDPKRVYLIDAVQSIIFVSTDEGLNFERRALSPDSIDPTSFLPHPTVEDWVLALDSSNRALYVSRDFGKTAFTKISDNVSYYQWGESPYDADNTLVYYKTDSASNSNIEVDLYTQKYPYTDATRKEFDPSLGPHDGFLMVDRYIFAQKTINNKATLWVSADRKPFKQAKIPSNFEHLNYIVDSVRSLQALVIVQHNNSQFNLYMSEEQGELYNLALADLRVIVGQRGIRIDLDVIASMNHTTYIANQFIPAESDNTDHATRTLISFDVGANWSPLTPPSSSDTECILPSCSLHLHMDSSEYWRTGVYSQESAPGIIIAHGGTGRTLNESDDANINLYISRDGGSSWSMTLSGTWGVSIVDMGGMIIAAKDYHNDPEESGSIKYSCNEGITWSELTFTDERIRVFAVITEPEETTTTASLYGRKSTGWVVITIEFSPVFSSSCKSSDYYNWIPFDHITDTGCLLGASVTVERRFPSHCCLNGRNYTRVISYSTCSCSSEDFECDYGYKHANGISGACVRDQDVALPETCTNGAVSFTQSQGYHKIGGDVCIGGVESNYQAYEAPCCIPTVSVSYMYTTITTTTTMTVTPSNAPTPSNAATPSIAVLRGGGTNGAASIALGVILAISLVINGIFIMVAVVICFKRKLSSEGYSRVPIAYHSSSRDPTSGDFSDEEEDKNDDDDKLIPL